MNLGEAFKKACHISKMAEERGIDPSELRALSDSEALSYIQSRSGNASGLKTYSPPVSHINDITDRVAPQINTDALLYPERAALAKKQREQNEKIAFAKSISELKKNERDNLKFLVERDGRVVIESKALEEMALSGEGLETERLEELKLIERELIKDSGPFGGNMIQFRITNKGRKIYQLFKSEGIYG